MPDHANAVAPSLFRGRRPIDQICDFFRSREGEPLRSGTVFALTLLIAESINKGGMTFAFHLRTPEAGRWVRESPDA